MGDVIAEAFAQGIKLGPTINKDRYICPETGAHFQFIDMCHRIKVANKERFKDPRFKDIEELGNPIRIKQDFVKQHANERA